MIPLSKSKKNSEVQEAVALQDEDHRKKKSSSGRKCRICGKDPYPNYFYCRGCHHKIEFYEEQ